MEFNISNGFAISKPVPLDMRVFAYQGGISLGNNVEYLLCGGVTDFMDKVKKNCYIYNAVKETA